MKKTDPISVGQALEEFFQERKLRNVITEGKAIELWKNITGDYIASQTDEVHLRDGVLNITISSAAVRSEIHMRRRYYISVINNKLGQKIVKQIIVRG